MRSFRNVAVALLVFTAGLGFFLLPHKTEAATGPRIIISGFSISPEPIEPGDDFDATVTLRNIGDQTAANIELAINEGAVSSPFAPYLISNTVSVQGNIEPLSEVQKTFRLGSSSTAAPGINNLYLTIRYQNDQAPVTDYVYSHTVGIPVKKPSPAEATRPKLTISQVRFEPQTVEVGQEFSLFLEVKNFGNQQARAVKVVADHLEGASGLDVFFPVGSSNAFALDGMGQGVKTEKALRFTVSPKAQAKTYNLVVEIEYRDREGQTYTASEVIGIPVYKGGKTFLVETAPQLIIQGHRVSQTPVAAGESFELHLDIYNAAQTTARNIRISLGEDDIGALKNFSPVTTSNTIFIPELTGGEQVTRNFSLAADKNAESRRYNLNVKMIYEDTNSKSYESSGMVSIPVKGKDGKNLGPELTVASYRLPAEQVEAGSSFQLTLNIKNIGDEPAKNARVVLANVEGTQSLDVFSPLGSGNTLCIKTLGPDESISKSMKLFVSGEAKSKIYNVVINFSCQGKDGAKYTNSEAIGIPVIEPRALKIVSLIYPTKVKPGEKFKIYSEFINTGKYPVENLFVVFKGDFEVDYPSYYLGKFEVGGSDVFETEAAISKPGEYKGQVVFTYTNNYQQEQVVTKPVRIIVEQPEENAVATTAKPAKESFGKKIIRFILLLLGLGGE